MCPAAESSLSCCFYQSPDMKQSRSCSQAAPRTTSVDTTAHSCHSPNLTSAAQEANTRCHICTSHRTRYNTFQPVAFKYPKITRKRVSKAEGLPDPRPRRKRPLNTCSSPAPHRSHKFCSISYKQTNHLKRTREDVTTTSFLSARFPEADADWILLSAHVTV